MTTKWGQRWRGATFVPGGTKFGGALRAEKRKERGWAKKHQGKVREVSKYVQVFCSPFFIIFFFNERFKTWRLVDCQITCVICKARDKLGQQRVYAKGTCGEAAGSYWGLLNHKLLASWEVFTPLHWHSEFTRRFYIKLFFARCSRSQWSWFLAYLPLKCRALSPYAAVGDGCKTRCIYKALSFCLQTKHG